MPKAARPRLTSRQILRIRELSAAGETQAAVARRVRCSQSAVSRVLGGEIVSEAGALAQAVETCLADFGDLKGSARVRGAAVTALARLVDQCAASGTAAAAGAAPRLVEQLLEVLSRLEEPEDDVADAVRRSLAWLRPVEARDAA